MVVGGLTAVYAPPIWACAREQEGRSRGGNTEALKAVFTPGPALIPAANATSSQPLQSAASRILYPTTSQAPRTISAMVAIQPTSGMTEAGNPARWSQPLQAIQPATSVPFPASIGILAIYRQRA